VTSTRSEPREPPSRRRPEKRAAIVAAARSAFSREGYARTSIETVAESAGVSTRTIYNHFGGKEDLFGTVLHASAGEVAETFVAEARAIMDGEGPLERRLIALGHALTRQRTEFPEHFALVSRIGPDAAHFPPATIRAWQQAGPERVQKEVARCLEHLAGSGELRVADPRHAAIHFIALTQAEIATSPLPVTERLPRRRVAAMVASGVEAFLHGYAAR
jgi:AcrR family transcriptional regulator